MATITFTDEEEQQVLAAFSLIVAKFKAASVAAPVPAAAPVAPAAYSGTSRPLSVADINNAAVNSFQHQKR
jgi:hypothetical protein